MKYEMVLKKRLARILLNEIWNGFIDKEHYRLFRRNVIALYEGNFITKKDCGILTDRLFDYELDNFHEFEV